MILNIITPVSRPENLILLKESISRLKSYFKIKWYCIFDPGKQSALPSFTEPWIIARTAGRPNDCSGGSQRNAALEEIIDGFVYFLDDDNKMHPSFPKRLYELIKSHPEAAGFIFSQDGLNHRDPLTACPENARVNYVDVAQLCMKRQAIGDTRFLENTYNSDGRITEELYARLGDRIVFVDELLCYYNALR